MVYEKDFANSIPGEFISIDSVKLPLSINASIKLTTGEDMKIKLKVLRIIIMNYGLQII